MDVDFEEKEAEWRIFGRLEKNPKEYPESTTLQKNATDIVDSISEPVALIYFICARNEDIIVIALIGCEAYLAVFNSLSLDRAVLYKKNFALVCDRERIFGIDLESKVLCFRLRVEKLSASLTSLPSA